MPSPFASSFAVDGTKDTSLSLAHGITSIVTTLTDDLAIDGEEMTVDDATGAGVKGVAVIEDEIVYYHGRRGKSRILELQRGQAGSSAALHLLGATVTFYNMPKFINPALVDALISMQQIINDQADVIADLQTRVTALEP